MNSALSAAISPSSPEIDTGQSVTLTATQSGGSGTYVSYQWYVNGIAQNPTTSTISFAPTSAGVSLVTVTVTDSLGASVTSNSAVVIVGASPTVSITPANSVSLTTGQTQTFAATASDGLGSLSYQWYIDGSPVGGNSASYTYTAVGATHSITCKVTDNAGATVTSAATAITVTSPQPSPTVSPSGTSSATPKQSPNQNGSSNSALPEILIIVIVALVAVGVVVGLTLNRPKIK